MKLKDKFDNPIIRHTLGRNEIEETKEQCAEIAEGFAIGFAEWIWGNCFNIFNNRFLYKDDEYSINELLEIYKKTL